MTDQPRKPAGQKDGGQYAGRPNTATGGIPPTTRGHTYKETLRLFQDPTRAATQLTSKAIDGSLTEDERKALYHVWNTQPKTDAGNLAGLMLENHEIANHTDEDNKEIGEQWDRLFEGKWAIDLKADTPLSRMARKLDNSITDYFDATAEERPDLYPDDRDMEANHSTGWAVNDPLRYRNEVWDPDAAWHDRDL